MDQEKIDKMQELLKGAEEEQLGRLTMHLASFQDELAFRCVTTLMISVLGEVVNELADQSMIDEAVDKVFERGVPSFFEQLDQGLSKAVCDYGVEDPLLLEVLENFGVEAKKSLGDTIVKLKRSLHRP